MAKPKLTVEEKEKRKLARKAAKKAARRLKKETIQPKETKTKSQFKIIEVAENDVEARKRLAELRENGLPISELAYGTGFFIYKVPLNVTGFAEHGTSTAIDNTVDDKPLKTIADLVAKVEADKEDGFKINKRYLKLLVRKSKLKRNLKREAVATLIKQFKIK